MTLSSLGKTRRISPVLPLSLPAELRGVELTMEQVEAHAGEPVTYVVRTIEQVAEEYDFSEHEEVYVYDGSMEKE